MYAVVKTGGKQYKVAAGQKFKVEQIAADVGQEIVLDQILAVGNGAELLRRRKHYQKRQGHRQNFTELFIAEIADGKGGVFKAEAAAVIAAPKAAKASPVAGQDDLEIIEGIGPKMAQVLIDNGVTTFAQVAAATVDDLTAMLKASGGRFSLASLPTWAEQAALLRDGKMDEFKKLTDELVGGVRK
jgi:large subunit ribosomal protein L21